MFGGIGVGVGAALDHGNSSTSALPAGSRCRVGSLSVVPTSYAGVAARVSPSVVNINVTTTDAGDTGSGVILRSDGYILTNNHVIAAAIGGNGRIAVTFNDGSTTAATIVGADAQDDLAVIKVARTNLAAASLGSASALHVGDAVHRARLAARSARHRHGGHRVGAQPPGRPRVTASRPVRCGSATGGATAGVTTVHRRHPDRCRHQPGQLRRTAGQRRRAGRRHQLRDRLQRHRGSGNIGVGFAIPIDQAKVIADAADHDRQGQPPVARCRARRRHRRERRRNGARAVALVQRGRLRRPACKVGDVIVAVGDQKTAGAEAVIAAMRTHQPGERVSVTVLRNGVRKTMTVTLANASDTQG